MRLRQRIRVSVAGPDGGKEAVLKTARTTLRSRLLRRRSMGSCWRQLARWGRVIRMPDKHAFLSPSSSERWFNCTKSAWLCEQFPDLGSVFAAEGTEAHRLCEFLLHRLLEVPDVDPRPGMQYYTQEMEETAQGYARPCPGKILRQAVCDRAGHVSVHLGK